MSSAPEQLPSPVEQHPPERRQRQKDIVVLYSCCCCCCCCLHTVGGALGAVLGGNYQPDTDRSAPLPKSLPSAQGLYWTSFLLALAIGLVGIAVFLLVSDGPGGPDGGLLEIPVFSVEAVGVSLILLGPLWLLAGSLLMAVRLWLRPDLRSHGAYWRSLGWITGFTLLGTVVGIGVMIPIFMLLGLVK